MGHGDGPRSQLCGVVPVVIAIRTGLKGHSFQSCSLMFSVSVSPMTLTCFTRRFILIL